MINILEIIAQLVGIVKVFNDWDPVKVTASFEPVFIAMSKATTPLVSRPTSSLHNP